MNRLRMWTAVCVGLVLTTGAGRAGLCAPGGPRQSDRVPVVVQGKACARLVIAVDAAKPAREAAALLADYIARSTGARLKIAQEPPPEDGLVEIHCGATAYVKGLNLDLAKMGPDGYVVAFPDARHVVLLGAGDSGQEYAAYEFLERFVGVRWLLPGTLGEHVPARTDLSLPSSTIRDEPRIVNRLLGGLDNLKGPSGDWPIGGAAHPTNQWAKRNRMRFPLTARGFSHNLWALFLPERYGETHPGFFPLLNGKRFVPKAALGKTTAQDVKAQCYWQPCFTAPGSDEEAIRTICDYFAKNPQAPSYSLGVNDSGGHCECDACVALDGGGLNAVRERDASDSYYRWCNSVVRGVTAQYPDKLFGLIAYSGVYTPPAGLTLDRHIIPFMTHDRMIWMDETGRRQAHAFTESWEKAASALGWYDYVYGGQRYDGAQFGYLAPRIYFHQMAESLRYGYKHNVRHYYAEAYPSSDWHEGPKLYLLLKLLWNPESDVDQVLKDWYACAVGQKAAAHLAEYFRFWEEFWTTRVPRTEWFQRGTREQYLPAGSDAYLAALTRADLRRCEDLLRRTLAATTTEMERTRAQMFLDSFLARRSQLEDGIAENSFPVRDLAALKPVATVVSSTFGQYADGWGNWQREEAKASFTHGGSIGHAAPGALRMDVTGARYSPICFLRTVPVTPGRMYRTAMWFRTQDVLRDARVSLFIQWKDEKGQWVSLPYVDARADAPEPGKWHHLSACFWVRPGPNKRWSEVRQAVVALRVEWADQGKVWFDDFRCEEVAPAR